MGAAYPGIAEQETDISSARTRIKEDCTMIAPHEVIDILLIIAGFDDGDRSLIKPGVSVIVVMPLNRIPFLHHS